jgi:chromosome segregation ATPase
LSIRRSGQQGAIVRRSRSSEGSWRAKYLLGELNVGAAHLVQELAEKIPGWIERILLPELSELKGEIKVVNAKIEGVGERLEAKIDSLDEKLSAKIDGLEGRMQGELKAVHTEIKRLDDKVDALEQRTDMTQRLAVVEERFRELRAKG